MALSATYYPDRGLTLAIVYGCTPTTEKAILERLQTVHVEAAQPLVLPGILAELELRRHKRLVDSNTNEVETKILELNFRSDESHRRDREQAESRYHSKREAWLDLTYLRNSMTTWTTQIRKMIEHADMLSLEDYSKPCEKMPITTSISSSLPDLARDQDEGQCTFPHHSSNENTSLDSEQMEIDSECSTPTNDFPRTDSLGQLQKADLNSSDKSSSSSGSDYDHDEDTYMTQMQKVGKKIEARLTDIEDEYDEMIRDCTMRVDGMAMATQWVKPVSHMHDTKLMLRSHTVRPRWR